jgi:hypothetical protein
MLWSPSSDVDEFCQLQRYFALLLWVKGKLAGRFSLANICQLTDSFYIHHLNSQMVDYSMAAAQNATSSNAFD